jgi:hypothetical protein
VANTGGNSCTGNNSTNNVGGGQTTQGGLIGLGLVLGGSNNISEGECTIVTGDAFAAGNQSDTTVVQHGQPAYGSYKSGAHHQPGYHQPGYFQPAPGSQFVVIGNEGAAFADTGNNTAVGNNSTTTMGGAQDTQGGLIGAGIVVGGPSNASQGSSTIQTGDASAVGNSAFNQAFQAFGN